MILIRESFVAKPGNASKLAKMFKELDWPGAVVMTDYTGQFNQVVIETRYENVQAWEKAMSEPMPKEMEEKFKNYTEMYDVGYRDIYRIW